MPLSPVSHRCTGRIIIFYIGIITLEGYVVVPGRHGRSMELNRPR